MNRRQHLLALLSAGLAAKSLSGADRQRPIQLHIDLHVDPGKEKEMVRNYRNVFQPAIRRQPGFVDVKLLKRRDPQGGTLPAAGKYRLIISFETEELRRQWTATEEHQQAWPTIGNTLTGSRYELKHYDEI